MIDIKKKISILIVPSLLMAVMVFFAIIPTISEIKEVSKNIKNKRETLELKPSPTQNIKDNINKLNKIKKTSKIYDSFVVRGEELDFIESLEKIAATHSIEQDISIGQYSNTKTEEELPVTIIIKGDYISILKYLTSLERKNYYINIQSINLDAISRKIISTSILDDELKRSNLIKVNIKALIYLR